MEEFVPYNKWVHQHDDDIKQEFPDRPTAELAGKVKANYYTVSRRAKRMGVSKSEEFMHTSWKKGAKKSHTFKDELRAFIINYMKEHFADTKNEEIATRFEVDVKTVRRWARKLGLVKSEEFMRSVRGKGQRTGYYTTEQKEWRNRRVREVYQDADMEALQKLASELGVSVSGIRDIARGMGLHKNRHVKPSKYGPELVESIRAYYPEHTQKECAEHFGLSVTCIAELAQRYGMRKSKAHVSEMQRKRWPMYDKGFADSFKEYFQNHTNKECAEHFNLPMTTVQNIAHRCGIKKSAEHLAHMADVTRKKHG